MKAENTQNRFLQTKKREQADLAKMEQQIVEVQQQVRPLQQELETQKEILNE